MTFVKDGTSKGPNCNGGDHTEDCLNLNIFIPENSLERGNLPVMVNMHGGAFVSGSNDQGSIQGRVAVLFRGNLF